MSDVGGTQLAQSVVRVALDLRVMSSSPTLGIEFTVKKKIQGRLGDSVGRVSDFGSGHDLAVREFKPHVCVVSAEPALDPLSPSLPLPRSHTLSLSLKNK